MSARRQIRFSGRHAAAAVVVALTLLLTPESASGWGANAHRLITNKAVDTLPPDLRAFFDVNRQQLVQASAEPLEAYLKNPTAERRNRYVYLDRYGRFPFENLPRDYNAAVRKFTKAKLEANGVLPWQIGLYSKKLTDAFKAHNWDDVRQFAAILAHYVAQAHDPFATTENFDGRLSNQAGADQRFSYRLVDRYSLFFFILPNEAAYISDPTDHAFESCLNAHSWLEQILLADRRARRGLPDYTDEYYDRLYNQAGAVLIRGISDAASDVGSYWLTAWINAGRPQLPGR
ncbi:MAG: hypothetical protein M1453_15230 [Acidobacteria bacterium]|nr:hypothetical protein [Acidobacteriota bacterium]MCL5289334.1 hypothetical protein [Acidobacteriota bacterium]